MASGLTKQSLLIGTKNSGKLREIRSLLGDISLQCISVSEIPQLSDIDVNETGSTYAENAVLKAKTYGQVAQLLTIAEDSGLEVEALEGFPGINSDRWLTGTYQDKNVALLERLDQLGSDINRSARFINVTCLFNPIDQSYRFFQGELLGTIAYQPSGIDGFGYDPIFIPKGYKQSLAELGQDVKNQISARAQSLDQLKKFLKTILI